MSQLKKDILVTRGDVKEITFTIKDNQAGAVKDITGYTGTFRISLVGSSTEVLNKSMVLVVAASGTIKVTLSATDTGTTLSEGRYECHIELNDGADDNTVDDVVYLKVRETKS